MLACKKMGIVVGSEFQKFLIAKIIGNQIVDTFSDIEDIMKLKSKTIIIALLK